MMKCHLVLNKMFVMENCVYNNFVIFEANYLINVFDMSVVVLLVRAIKDRLFFSKDNQIKLFCFLS